MINALKDSILEIMSRADECIGAESDFDKGRLMAFNEVLSILKTDMQGEQEIEGLLDFNIDEKY